ncbi:NUDIX hydrolase [Paraclostridium ghonii]|uniref:NUDIX hydrolase n=1 Tax=Paraclostridium ghonii TaxID=29358 RepID=UPI00202CEF55|nr:NUDIX hydrolase [Paeniclostridium ghonii]MCM0166460.1 NUDIX hydrolase [Paeniclostridium ghonii]
MKENRIKELKPLAQTKFLSIYDATYTNKLGNEKHWMIASRKGYETLANKYFRGEKDDVDAVVIAAFHEESKKLVIVKQFRVPLNDYVYELPAGLVENNEKEEVAVKRELKEETGLNLLKINENLGNNQLYLSPGMTEESSSLIYCSCEGELSTKYLEEDEDIVPMLVSREEAKKLITENVKMDIKAFMTLQSFALFGEEFFRF